MKKLAIIPSLFLFNISFSQPTQTRYRGTRSDTMILLSSKTILGDSLFVSVKELEELNKTLSDKNNNPIKDILPSIVALLVVIISTGSTMYLGTRQIQVQKFNAEQQLRSQEAQSQEQLKLARDQIHETSNMTLVQVRANNISQARINWIQDLRNVTSEFVGEMTILNFYLREVVDLYGRGDEKESERLYNIQIERIKKVRESAFKIRLLLNQEKNHLALENLINTYISAALEGYKSGHVEMEEVSAEILNVSRRILKEAWEQAKHEGRQ